VATVDVGRLVNEISELEQVLKDRHTFNKFKYFNPYPYQHAFFKLGADKLYRLLMAANQVGKTLGAGYEVTCHLTGLYPADWEGRRFDEPTKWWAGSESAELTKEGPQRILCGDPADAEVFGSGMIPLELIRGKTNKPNTPDGFQTIRVSHVSGGTSLLTFKSYDQGRTKWQSETLHGVWLDEEPPLEIYTEAMTRIVKMGGIGMLTFTPLKGMSDVVAQFIEPAEGADTSAQGIVSATWDDAPHLTEEAKTALYAALPPHEREARSKGVPALGSGRIYPYTEDGSQGIVIDDMYIPAHWPRMYALDVGWNRTAAGWFAWDRESDVVYMYSEHYQGEQEVTLHAKAIKARGAWMPGVIDPHANDRSQRDGERIMALYIDEGLELTKADNAVEAGILRVWLRMATGRFKVFRSCVNTLNEGRLYRRDLKGKIVKKNDHLMDVIRYGMAELESVAIIEPIWETIEGGGDIQPDDDGFYF